MAGVRRRSYRRWLSFLSRREQASRDGNTAFFVVLRVVLVMSAAAIVMLRWYFVDARDGYRVERPSPRTYLARVSARFVDDATTKEVRNMAADQIVDVRVRNNSATSVVRSRISDLKNTGDMGFAPEKLREIVNSMSDDVREQVIDAAVEISEKNYDKSATRSEQTAVIWDNLRNADMSQAEKNVVFQLADALLVPTIVGDEEMAERLRNDVTSHIPAMMREIRVGDPLILEKQVVTPETASLLRASGYPDAAVPWRHLAFVIIITIAWSFWQTWLGRRQESPSSRREWIYIVVLLILCWAVQAVPSRWEYDSLTILPLAGWMFLTLPPMFAFHLVLGGGLIGYILAFPGFTSMIAVGCIICAVAAGAASVVIQEASSRIKIWANLFSLGFYITLTSSFVRWGFGLPISARIVIINLGLGALWSSIVVAVIPLWEYIFDIISPLRLLEMSHPSQPLLKRLQLEAPGTYHHTVSVGTLAEAVADRMRMNGLLVRTGAFYHDIGKLKRPHYFVENQSFGDNIHDRLAPGDSARMILSHVPDGLKLADDYKLPHRMKDFISEHHGRTFLGYFYQKAVDADKEAGGDGSRIDRTDFTYQGPTPQSPETALLMLADSVDAALKGLKNPLEGRGDLEKLVNEVVNSKIMSGQFVDVDFTLKDINAIKNAMVDALMSMYHTREIKPLKTEEKSNSVPAAQPASAHENASREPNGAARADAT
ncbi:MAG: HDIG domain-containing protein [Synergistaceae bacterium]|nr:HDIG domain-containing protein [Synergistaceae bacterium]